MCGSCGVRVLEGTLAPPDELELEGLRRAPAGVRLACRALIDGPVALRPVVSRTPHALPQLSSGAPTLGAGAVLASTVAAVDLGTSTVAAVIIESDSRVEVGRGAVSNRQSMWGADVLSRISAATSSEAEALRRAAEASVLDALSAACTEESLCLRGIERLIIAGNSAMSGLLLGMDVSGLAAHPFTAPFSGLVSLPAENEIVAALAEGAEAHVLPPLAGFIGGDVLAGLVAEGLSANGTGLLLDLGTNAEVVRARPEGFVVASAAAGPAFEAGGISSGGPAARGAVHHAAFDPVQGLVLDVIGGVEPQWLCGSGLVSLIALLRRLGHLAEDGLFCPEGPLRELFFDDQGVKAIRVAGVASSAGPSSRPETEQPEGLRSAEAARDVVLSQLDVRAFQLAKAAVRTAFEAVWSHGDGAGIDDVMVAGGFGASLAIGDLAELGVLPSDYANRARVVGNTALLGAAMIAVDATLEGQLAGMGMRVEHVDMALEAAFADRYLGALELAPWALRAAEERGR